MLILVAIIVVCFGFIAFIGAPYVPTHGRAIRNAFTELYTVTSDDLLVDLGSGDGIILRAFARRGGRAIGYELNPFLVAISILLRGRHTKRIKVICRNFWHVRFPEETTLVYAFADGRSIARVERMLRRHVTRTGRPVRFMSYGFELKGVEHDATSRGMFLYTIAPSAKA